MDPGQLPQQLGEFWRLEALHCPPHARCVWWGRIWMVYNPLFPLGEESISVAISTHPSPWFFLSQAPVEMGTGKKPGLG